ncbi:MAG TPA: pantetheine-phosphate adenylyltransferase [Burkholderiales bacterium]|jgi:pantetheine-phosphate adenylyltransferase|nr:pantetheine-phosphate adenylyltransferase [Burkholderiales bacterium]
MKKIAFSGTLDPITNGHMWVIGEARALADEVVIFISENPLKAPQFSADKRKEIVEQSIAERGWENASVILVKGDYTARAAKRHGIDYLIRGIRNTTDFDYENLIQQANVDVLQGAKTIFVMPPRDLGSVSSTFVRALQGPVGWHWTMQKFVPRPAYEAWILDWLRKDWVKLWRYGSAKPEAITNADRWFEQLVGDTAYGASRRKYHNLDHLVHGLSEIAVWAANTGAKTEEVEALKKAFWFHDAVYAALRKEISNEEASAQLWLEAKLDTDGIEGTANLIRVTDHLQRQSISHPLKDVMLGVDLAILGQAEDVYDAYACAVREEYRWMSDEAYWSGRKAILEHFQGRANKGELYADPYFAGMYQTTALKNIEREIATL